MANLISSDSQPVLKNFVPYKPKRGEVYMNEKQRDHFKKILLDWRKQLMQEVDRTVLHMQDDAGNYPDPADRATQEEEFSLELRTRDRERKLIRKIDGTIEAFRVNDVSGFAYAVQWHPEWKVLENPLSLSIFKAFGDACREYAQQK